MVHSLLIILMTAALMTLSSSVEPGDSLLGNFLSSLCFLAQTAIFLLRSVELLSEDASPLMDVCPDVSGGIVNLCMEPQNQEDNEDSSSATYTPSGTNNEIVFTNNWVQAKWLSFTDRVKNIFGKPNT